MDDQLIVFKFQDNFLCLARIKSAIWGTSYHWIIHFICEQIDNATVNIFMFLLQEPRGISGFVSQLAISW